MARQPLTLELDCCVQCAFCNMWNNLRDIGRAEPGICVYCDELAEIRSAADDLRAMAAEGGELAQDMERSYRELCESIGAIVRAMRAGLA